METMSRVNGGPISATLRDLSPSNVDAATMLARELKLAGVTVGRGDAFDRRSLGSVRPRPSIAIVSGLYELFPDNARVAESLLGLAEALGEGGYLIYTNQPWHPQLEMIARVLDNREGKPWVMRCRAQMEMDNLVRAAGFEKLETLLDRQGIEELAANEFRITQTESKIRREAIRGEEAAINTHVEVGREVRDAIRRVGNTMPEDLTPEPPIKEIEKRLKPLRKIPHAGTSSSTSD
jgi:hypothetical protein